MPSAVQGRATTQAEASASLREQMVDTGEARLHTVTQGSGPPVLLLHGFPEFWYSWRHQMQALADAGFTAIAPDLRGYNLSDKPQGRSAYRVEKLIADIEGLLAALGHSKAHIVGHDWGGYLAFYLAAHRPKLVDRLVVLNGPHPKIMARELSNPRQLAMSWYMFFFQLPRLPERLITTRKGLARIFHGPDVGKGSAFSDDDLSRYVAAMKQPGAATASINWYRAAFSPPRFSRRIPPIQAPTLVLWGERDRFLGTGQLRGLEREARDLTVVRFPDAGHWLQQERPREVSERIVQFFGKAGEADGEPRST